MTVSPTSGSGSGRSPTRPLGALHKLPTRQLVDAVMAEGFESPSWREVERRVVGGALKDLTRSIRDGSIHARCAAVGVPIAPCTQLRENSHPEVIAAEAVENCLLRFQNRVIPGGEWDPDALTLEDFFCVCALSDVANRWRWHQRRTRAILVPYEDQQVGSILRHPERYSPDPADAVERHELLERALATMSSQDRTAFDLIADGWTLQDIANHLGIKRGALDVRLHRARSRARQQGGQK